MSSRFTATRHTRKRPPTCHTSLRAGVPAVTPAHPAVLVADATWIDTPGFPPVSIAGSINLYETSPGASWTGIIYSGNQTLRVTVTKTPGATTCQIAILVTAEGIPEGENYGGVPCTPELCNWSSPYLETINTPGVDWHGVQVAA